MVTDVHERVKIYNKDGFDWATKKIGYYKNGSATEHVSGLKAFTYNIVDGKLIEEKLNKSNIFEEVFSEFQVYTNFTMPAVTEGSVIEYEYSIRSPFVTSIERIPLQYGIPINRIEVKVTIPEFFGFKRHYNPRSPYVFDVEESKKNFTITNNGFDRTDNIAGGTHTARTTQQNYTQFTYRINKDNIPGLKEEGFLDYIDNYAAFVDWELQFTKFPNSPVENLSSTWESVSKTMFNEGSFKRDLERTGYYEKDLDQLLSGISDPLIKAQKIYYFVKTKVKWNNYLGYGPHKGSNIAYRDGEGNVGDINILVTSMLRYAGLKANPVLVSTKNNGVPVFPTLKGFNYLISAVEVAGNTYLLDATDPFTAFGELPSRARNWLGRRLLDKETSDWVSLIPKEFSHNTTSLSFKLEDDMMLKGKNTQLLDGFHAKSYRDSYFKLNEENYIQLLEKDKGDIIISNLETENDKVLGENIKQSYEFTLKDGVQIIGDKIYIKPLLFMAETESPFKASERSLPIFFDFPSQTEKVVNFIIPEGYKVESVPENILLELNAGAGKYKFTTLQNGSFLRIQSALDIQTIVYAPSDYESLKNFFSLMGEKQAEVIVLTRI